MFGIALAVAVLASTVAVATPALVVCNIPAVWETMINLISGAINLVHIVKTSHMGQTPKNRSQTPRTLDLTAIF